MDNTQKEQWVADPETISGCIGLIAQFGTDDPLTSYQEVENKLIVRIIIMLREHQDIALAAQSNNGASHVE